MNATKKVERKEMILNDFSMQVHVTKMRVIEVLEGNIESCRIIEKYCGGKILKAQCYYRWKDL